MLPLMESLRSTHLEIKSSGTVNTEKLGSSNQSYLTALLKKITQIKVQQGTELDQMSNSIKLLELEPTPTSEIIHP